MFNCYNHGWSHIERECPKCFPAHITTSTSTTFILPDAIVGINKSELDRLQSENARYIERIEELTSELSKLKVQADRHREALQAYADLADGDWYGPDDRYYNIGDTAREALKGE